MSNIRAQFKVPMPARVDHQIDEPAYGLYLRTCAANGRVRTYTAFQRCGITTGQSVSDIDPINVAHLCKNEPGPIAWATPKVTPAGVSLFNDRVGRDHFSAVHRRWCPACLEESPHHRVWWDIQYVTACPDHGIKILEDCGCERKPLWKRSHPLRCVAHHDFRDAERSMAGEEERALSSYVRDRTLSRHRVGTYIVDSLPTLGDVLSVCDQIGRASLDVGVPLPRLRERLGRGAVAAEGFRILANFPSAFEELLDRLVGRPRPRMTSIRQWGVEHAYGDFYVWLANQPGESEFFRLLKVAIAAHAEANLTLKSGHKVAGIEVKPALGVDLTTAAERWGVTFERFRRLATTMGILPKGSLRGRPARLDEALIEEWAPVIRSAKTREEVARELDIAPHVCGQLIGRGILPAIVDGKADRKNRLNIWLLPDASAADLLAELIAKTTRSDEEAESLASLPVAANAIRVPLATLIRLVLDGKLRVRRLDPAKAGLGGVLVSKSEAKVAARRQKHPGVTITEAGNALGLHADMMAQLRDRGLVQATKVGRLWLIDYQEVDRLRDRYVTLAELALALGGVHLATAISAMRKRRVRPACERPEFRQTLFFREAALKAVTRHLAPRTQRREMEPALGNGPYLDCKDAASRMKIDPQLVRQLAESGMLPGRRGASGLVIDVEALDDFTQRNVSASELAVMLGKERSSFRAVRPILERAGIGPSCERPQFYAAMYPRAEATAAIKAHVSSTEAPATQGANFEGKLLTSRDVQERLGMTDLMVSQLRRASMIEAPACERTAFLYSQASVEEFEREFVAGSRLREVAEDRSGEFAGNSLTLLLKKAGVDPVCKRPRFQSYVFRRAEVRSALHAYFVAEDAAAQERERASSVREGQITLRAFQQRLGISSNTGSRLVREGLLQAHVHASTILVDSVEVDRFTDRYVTAREVTIMLGRKGANAAISLLANLAVDPIPESRRVLMNFFDRTKVQRAIAAWQADPTLAAPTIKRPDDVLIAANIRAALRCPDTLVKELVRSGLLPSTRHGNATVVQRSDFNRFRATYTLPNEYMEAFGCEHPKPVTNKLVGLGLRSLSAQYGLCRALFARKDVEAALARRDFVMTASRKLVKGSADC